jgi:hypothetical protein
MARAFRSTACRPTLPRSAREVDTIVGWFGRANMSNFQPGGNLNLLSFAVDYVFWGCVACISHQHTRCAGGHGARHCQVAGNDRAIAYVDKSAVDASVKAVLRID